MCLIIQREPNFEIPFDKFESAIEVNPDGYGISYPSGDGKLMTLRSPEKPDAEKLYRVINEDLIEAPLLIHLRFTTAGETILRNSHPFPILEKDKDGIDLRMAHNGTLGKYKPAPAEKSNESDTRRFVKEFVRPLFKRLARGMDPEELMTDPFTKKILEDQLTTASVLTFLDGEGRSLLCNAEGNGGKKEEGWYYSNSYSFNRTHREKGKSVVGFTGGRTTYYPPIKTATKTNGTSTSVLSKPSTLDQSTNRTKFSEQFNVQPHELSLLTDETIECVLKEGKGFDLIAELLYENKKLRKDNQKLSIQKKRLQDSLDNQQKVG